MQSLLWALLLGASMLLGSLFSYCLATTLIVHLVIGLIRTGYTGLSFWKNVVVMMVISLVTASAHVVQIALWAAAFVAVGEMSTFDRAFYCSAQNYTALGYGDIVLSEKWRVLGPLEAINGLLLFGLSTGVMFAVMNRIIVKHLHLQGDHGSM
jgi:Ion channel